MSFFRYKPRRRIIADAEQRHRSHANRVNPATNHDPDGVLKLQPLVQIYRVSNREPPLNGDYGEGENGQVTGEDGEKAGSFAAHACHEIDTD